MTKGRMATGRLWGVGSLLKFWGPERPPPSKIEKPIKSHGSPIGISHQIDPTPKGREGGGGRRETGPAAPREGRAGREGRRETGPAAPAAERASFVAVSSHSSHSPQGDSLRCRKSPTVSDHGGHQTHQFAGFGAMHVTKPC